MQKVSKVDASVYSQAPVEAPPPQPAQPRGGALTLGATAAATAGAGAAAGLAAGSNRTQEAPALAADRFAGAKSISSDMMWGEGDDEVSRENRAKLAAIGDSDMVSSSDLYG